MAAIGDYPWPGNVRELKHVIERAVLGWAGGDEIGNVSLGSPAAGGGALRAPAGPASPFPPAGLSLAQWERAMIDQALREAGGNQAKAARLLGITRDTLRYRMAKFKISS